MRHGFLKLRRNTPSRLIAKAGAGGAFLGKSAGVVPVGAYLFDGRQYFQADTLLIDPADLWQFEAFVKPTLGAGNMDLMTTFNNTLMISRIRGATLDTRAFINGTGNNGGPAWIVDETFTMRYDFSTINLCTVSKNGTPAAPVAVGAGGVPSPFVISGTSLRLTGYMGDCRIFNTAGTLIHHWDFSEGSGETITDIVGGEVMQLVGPPGVWV